MKALSRRLEKISSSLVLGIILVVALGTSLLSAFINLVFNVSNTPEWWVGWLQNFSTEMFGAFLTFVLLEMLVRGRQEKERLIRQMHSKDNGLALQAVGELGAHGWLGDGSLVGARLVTANLRGMRMWDADLKETDLHGANLAQTRLERVNFSRANLWSVDLGGARLYHCNLEGADLMYANLTESTFKQVEMDQDTRLPDGSYWSPETDLERFTDPHHPHYWQPNAEQIMDSNVVIPPVRVPKP